MPKFNHQFRLDLPEAWDDQSSYTFMGPEVNGFRHLVTLNIDADPLQKDLESYAQDRIAMVKQYLPDAETLKEELRVLPNRQAVYDWVYKYTSGSGVTEYHRQSFMLLDGRGYTFSANFTKQTWKTIGVDVERLIASFAPSGA